MIACVPAQQAHAACEQLVGLGEQAWIIGAIEANDDAAGDGRPEVRYQGALR
jgi:phosphoribosylaminoimidazole (AIR) synthetase